MKALAPALLLCALAPSAANAQFIVGPPAGSGAVRHGGGMHGHRDGVFLPVWVGERETVVVEREVIREVPAAPPPPPPEPPPPPRKPYVIGASYASLPGGCMKMVEASGTYFYCSGEWYRQVGSDQYKAVREP